LSCPRKRVSMDPAFAGMTLRVDPHFHGDDRALHGHFDK
jgi:hypothetical protein